jgi:hypothetical protein
VITFDKTSDREMVFVRNDAVIWINAIGGVTGLVSAGYVLIERVMKRPKILSSISFATFRWASPSRSDEKLRCWFDFKLAVGNVGNELTTIVKSEIFVNETKWQHQCLFKDNSDAMKPGSECLVLSPGFAGSYRFFVGFAAEKQIEVPVFTGILTHHLIGGRKIEKKIIFILDEK